MRVIELVTAVANARWLLMIQGHLLCIPPAARRKA